MRVSELQTKDVVNVADGRILGQVQDVELQLPGGQVEAIVVPSEVRWFGLRSSGPALVIPWQQIERIGSDVILVCLHTGGETSPMEKHERELASIRALQSTRSKNG